MIRAAAAVTIVSIASGCGPRQDAVRPPTPQGHLAAQIDSTLADPAYDNAVWGVVVQSVDDGGLLYRRNPYKLFMPASNMKLVTAAVALAELGLEHRIPTRVYACGSLQNQVLDGDLMVVGAGDPSISARFNEQEAPLAVFEAWADSLRRRGIRRVTGSVVADDDRFEDVHIGPGWAWDYLDASYAAEVGALLLNDGALAVRVIPGAVEGDTATVELEPPTSYVEVEGAVMTVSDTTDVRMTLARDPFTNVVHLAGEISSAEDTIVRTVAVHDPTMYFATVLTETLHDNGIDVTEAPVDRDLDPTIECDSAVMVVEHFSPPVSEMIVPFLKVSQNQMGEMFLRYLGAAATDTGSVVAGRRVVESRLTSWGVSPRGYVYYDGSGLSRYNYLSPDTIVRLLRVMALREDFAAFYNALPIAGEDGTLENRFRRTRAEGNVRAKTGFISNARALSGYVTTRDGERLAFSLMANDFDVPVRVVEYAQDLIVELLANYSESGGSRPRATGSS